jgi:hypothetical protein
VGGRWRWAVGAGAGGWYGRLAAALTTTYTTRRRRQQPPATCHRRTCSEQMGSSRGHSAATAPRAALTLCICISTTGTRHQAFIRRPTATPSTQPGQASTEFQDISERIEAPPLRRTRRGAGAAGAGGARETKTKGRKAVELRQKPPRGS